MKKFRFTTLLSLFLMVSVMVSQLTSFAAGGIVNGNFSGKVTLPTTVQAYKDGEVQKAIFGGVEESKAKPWVYADVKLESVRTQNEKLNYANLALKRAIAYFQDQKQHFDKNDYFIILNNGFVINRENFDSQKVYDEAKKALIDEELYQGDTLFTLAFLSGKNTVVNQSIWKLIDMVNLAPGSSFTSSTSYKSGVTDVEEAGISELLGFRTAEKFGGSIGIKKAGIDASLRAEMEAEINTTLKKTFSSSNTVSTSKDEQVTVKHGSQNSDMYVLRYQLVNNLNVDLDIFKEITAKLDETLNMGGRKIVSVEPSSGLKGIDVGTNIIFDLMISK